MLATERLLRHLLGDEECDARGQLYRDWMEYITDTCIQPAKEYAIKQAEEGLLKKPLGIFHAAQFFNPIVMSMYVCML